MSLIDNNELLGMLGLAEQKQESTPTEDVTPEMSMQQLLLGDETEQPQQQSEQNQQNQQEQPDNKLDETQVEQTEVKKTRFGIKDTIDSLIESGEWEDTAVKYGDKEYDSIQDLISSEKLTKELLIDLSAQQKLLREEKYNESYINVEGLDESRKRLLQGIANGIEYEDLIELDRDVIQPTLNLDISEANIDEVRNFVRHGLLNYKNFPEKYLDAEIDSIEKSFQLNNVARELQREILAEYQAEIENRERAIAEETQMMIESRNQSIYDMSNKMRDMGYDESFATMASSLTHNVDEEGIPHYVLMLEQRLNENPEFAIDFAHFLISPEDFISRKTANVKTETTKRMLHVIKGNNKPSGTKQSVNVETDMLQKLGLV